MKIMSHKCFFFFVVVVVGVIARASLVCFPLNNRLALLFVWDFLKLILSK